MPTLKPSPLPMILDDEKRQVLDCLLSDIRASRAKRLPVAPLLATLQGRFPRLDHDGLLRPLLAELLDELGAAGHIRPVRSQGQDGSGYPPLPRQIQRLDPPRQGAAPDPALTAGLHPALDPSRLGRWSPGYDDLLPALSRRLWNPRPVLPRNHLSWRLLGDEKRLARHQGLIRDTLSLSDEQLGMESFHEPLAYRLLYRPVRRVLIVENAETFHIACRRAPMDAVAYGGGKQILTNWTNLLPLAPEQIAYFGDWDPEGLRILLALRERGCPCRPWLPGYRALWREPPAADGLGGPALQDTEADAVAELFPEAPPARLTDLRNARRVPQEAWLG